MPWVLHEKKHRQLIQMLKRNWFSGSVSSCLSTRLRRLVALSSPGHNEWAKKHVERSTASPSPAYAEWECVSPRGGRSLLSWTHSHVDSILATEMSAYDRLSTNMQTQCSNVQWSAWLREGGSEVATLCSLGAVDPRGCAIYVLCVVGRHHHRPRGHIFERAENRCYSH